MGMGWFGWKYKMLNSLSVGGDYRMNSARVALNLKRERRNLINKNLQKMDNKTVKNRNSNICVRKSQ